MSMESVHLVHNQQNRTFSLMVGDKEIKGVRSYSVKAGVDEITSVTVEIITDKVWIDGVFTPANVTFDKLGAELYANKDA